MSPPKSLISVLITSHNRRAQTLRCLNSLYNQADGHDLRVTLVDDNSSDGTAETVEDMFPQTQVISGDGTLFWGGGMRLAQAVAGTLDYDFLLWLNDDVTLFSSALSDLLTTYYSTKSQLGNQVLVVGALREPDREVTTYSGLNRTNRWRPLRFRTVEPTSQPLECDTMNGNLVLVPRGVAALLGPIDAAFSHAMGDIDYGLRATSAGCRIILAPDHVGVCERNTTTLTHLDPSLSAGERLKHLSSPKGIPPMSWATFARRYGGFLWPIYWVSPYLRAVLLGFTRTGKGKIRSLSKQSRQ